ncbi:hypothetical protein NKF71_001250 [Salmonella enterica]|nr:hypothetical protein [Salmonella enterica]
MTLKVFQTDFDSDVEIANLQSVLEYSRLIIDDIMGSKLNTPVSIYHYNNVYSPMVFYDRGINGEFMINLGSHDTQYDRYIYQFIHEYCHIRTNYREHNRKLGWFEESICETASLYFLDIISTRWNHNPPLKYLKGYDKFILEYQKKVKQNVCLKQDFLEWFSFKRKYFDETHLEEHSSKRNDYFIISKHILPLFYSNPELWNALTYWNAWEQDINDNIDSAFNKWLFVLPENRKKLAMKLIKRLTLK